MERAPANVTMQHKYPIAEAWHSSEDKATWKCFLESLKCVAFRHVGFNAIISRVHLAELSMLPGTIDRTVLSFARPPLFEP